MISKYNINLKKKQMRDILNKLDILTESALSAPGLQPGYLKNLIDLVGKPLAVVPKMQDKLGPTVILAPEMKEVLQQVYDSTGGRTGAGGYLIMPGPFPKLTTTTGDKINLSAIEKSPEIKGKTEDYGVGDIGEIALGVSAGARFLNAGKPINYAQFVGLANQLTPSIVRGKSGKVLDSLQLSYTGRIKHESGKEDNFTLVVMAPGRSVKEFANFMKKPKDLPPAVQGTILSAIDYANGSERITAGIQQASASPDTNTIEVSCDGVSNQKGTKADLVMTIDGSRIHLISAKAGPSQLGQASGHQWANQQQFFQTVFGVDIAPYAQAWGKTNQEHLTALQQIWSRLVIPKVQQLTGGDSVQKEKMLIRSLANGLIRYSNNTNAETGEVETIDIVKLLTDPGSPGYSLLRIDSRLTAALEKTDLYGESTKNGQGIQVSGQVNGKKSLLFKARSYYSPAGKVVRTIIEGGPLLDELALATLAQAPAGAPPVKEEESTPERPKDNIKKYGRAFQR
jgi:hypothetical protein